MSILASPLASPLGWPAPEGTPDRWIGNVTPAQGSVRPASPITMSSRHSASDQAVAVALADVTAYFATASRYSIEGSDIYAIPGARRSSTLPGEIVVGGTPTAMPDGLHFEKTSNDPQASVFRVPLTTNASAEGYLISASITPTTIADADGHTGVVLGLDLGFAGTAAYLLLKQVDGIKRLELRGPVATSLAWVAYDWTGEQSYTLVWDAVLQRVQVFVTGSSTIRAFSEPLSRFTAPDGTTRALSTDSEVVGLYGIEGEAGNAATFHRVYLPEECIPLLTAGATKRSYAPKVAGSDLIAMTSDPFNSLISNWGPPPTAVAPSEDPAGVISYDDATGVLSFVRATELTTLMAYREDTDLGFATAAGVRIRVKFSATSTTSSTHAGMGVLVFDGASAIELALIRGPSYRSVALRTEQPVDVQMGFVEASPAVDWSSVADLDVEIDGQRNELRVYEPGGLVPLINTPYDPAKLRSASSLGWTGLAPFIAFGHVEAVSGVGTLEVHEFSYSLLHDVWRPAQQVNPTLATPPFTEVLSAGSRSSVDGELVVSHAAGQALALRRPLHGGLERGFYIDAAVRITEHKTGVPLDFVIAVLNAQYTFGVTLLDSPEGKFCAVLLADGEASKVIYGDSGDALKYSFRVDWAQPHAYLVRAVPFFGLEVYLDYGRDPVLRVPFSELPVPQYATFDTAEECEALIGFIRFGGTYSRGARVSKWGYVRTGGGTGYELGFQPPSRLSGALIVAAAVGD